MNVELELMFIATVHGARIGNPERRQAMAKRNPIFKLMSIDASTYPENKLRELVTHLQNQINTNYIYLVGEWAGSRKARNIRDTGRSVGKQEVIDYLNNIT